MNIENRQSGVALSIVIRLTLPILVGVYAAWGCCSPVCGQSSWFHNLEDREAAQLEQFLAHRKMDRLLIRHVESRLDREQRIDSRPVLVRRLARLYEKHLLSSSLDEFDARLLGRAENLVRANPTIETPALRLSIQHARYQEAEKKFRTWWAAGGDAKHRSEIAQRFREVHEILTELKKQNEHASRIAQTLPETDPHENRIRSQRLLEIENRVMHCRYLLGWTTYFLGVSNALGEKQWLFESEGYFRHFLEIQSASSIEEITGEWFDLSTPWHVRAMVGLAMGQVAANQLKASEHCFDVLEQRVNDANTISLIDVWKLNSRLFARKWGRAVEFTNTYQWRNITPTQRRLFWQAAVRGSRSISIAAPALSQEMLRVGVRGLARDFDAVTIQTMVDNELIVLDGSGFLNEWVRGYLLYYNADVSKNSFDQARAVLKSAISAATEDTPQNDVARCRYLVAMINFRTGNLAACATELKSIAQNLKSESPVVAADAQWLRARALARLCRKNSRLVGEAFAALDRMTNWFPDSQYASKIAFERLKLESLKLPAEDAIEGFRSVSRSSSDFAEAQFEIVRNRHRQWSRIQSGDRTLSNTAFQVLVAEDRDFRNLGEARSFRKLKSLLLVIDAQLKRDANPTVIEQQFLKAQSYLAEPGDVRELASQVVYYQLIAAKKFNRSVVAMQHAEWIATHAVGSPYELFALVYVAQNVPDLNEITAAEAVASIPAIKRLVELLGESDEEIRRNENARRAIAKLVVLYQVSNQFELAGQLADKLVELFPRRQEYLLTSARIKTVLGDFTAALPIWRRLAAGVLAGSDPWYESKYELARCVSKTDPNSALRLLQQTVELSPDLPAQWREKFGRLVDQINSK